MQASPQEREQVPPLARELPLALSPPQEQGLRARELPLASPPPQEQVLRAQVPPQERQERELPSAYRWREPAPERACSPVQPRLPVQRPSCRYSSP